MVLCCCRLAKQPATPALTLAMTTQSIVQASFPAFMMDEEDKRLAP